MWLVSLRYVSLSLILLIRRGDSINSTTNTPVIFSTATEEEPSPGVHSVRYTTTTTYHRHENDLNGAQSDDDTDSDSNGKLCTSIM